MPPAPSALTVVIDDPRDPLSPDLDLGAVGQIAASFSGIHFVVVAVGDPPLQLLAGQLAGIHPHVERVQIVVARSLRAQAR